MGRNNLICADRRRCLQRKKSKSLQQVINSKSPASDFRVDDMKKLDVEVQEQNHHMSEMAANQRQQIAEFSDSSDFLSESDSFSLPEIE